jgi:hypothetical protein
MKGDRLTFPDVPKAPSIELDLALLSWITLSLGVCRYGWSLQAVREMCETTLTAEAQRLPEFRAAEEAFLVRGNQ